MIPWSGKGVKDPLKNYAFDVHQYLDSDSSGTHRSVVSENIGVDRIKAITAWAKKPERSLHGEFGVASDSTSLKGLDNMLSYTTRTAMYGSAPPTGRWPLVGPTTCTPLSPRTASRPARAKRSCESTISDRVVGRPTRSPRLWTRIRASSSQPLQGGDPQRLWAVRIR